MAILNHGSTIRTADGGQSTTTIVTASNIGTYGVAANSTYFIGTTQNVFNRASGAQTLTGVSIDGNAANITSYTINQNVGTGNTPSFAGIVSSAVTNYAFLQVTDTNNFWITPGNNNWGLYFETSAGGLLGGTGDSNRLGFVGAGAARFYVDLNNGNGWFGASLTANTDVRAPIFYDSANTAYYLDAANSGTSLLVAGNVGIGTTSPSAKLHVAGTCYISDYLTISKDLGFPISTTSAYFGYSPNASSSAGSLLELVHSLSGAIGANDPLRFRAVSLTQESNDGITYTTEVGPPAYSNLLNGNASSFINVFTFDEYNSGIRFKRFVVDLGAQYRRPNFITIQSDYGGNNFYGYTILIEKSVDNSTWTTACSTQTQPNSNSRVIAFNLGDLFSTRYIRFTFGASQAITSGGALTINCIRSYSNQNYSSEIPVFTDSSASLYSKNATYLATIAGNVGIGTTSPGYKLDVNTANDSAIRIRNGGGGANNGLALSVGSGSPWLDIIEGVEFRIKGNTYANIGTWNSGNNTKLLINSSGNVGIGTTSPSQKLHVSGIAYSDTDFRAPIFYDSNDTAYYVNPNSVSNLSSLRIFSAFDTASSDVYANMRVMRNNATTDGMYIGYGNSGSTAALTRIFGGGATTGELSKYSTYTLEPGSFRSPIFYDSDNTAYYIDAASTSVLNILTVSKINNLNAAVTTWHTSSEGKARLYFANSASTYFGTGNNFVFRNTSDSGILTIDSSGNLRTTTGGDNFASYSLHVGGTGFATADFRSPIFYDSDNTSYYVNPAGTTNLNTITVNDVLTYGVIAAKSFSVSVNTSTYWTVVRPNGSSIATGYIYRITLCTTGTGTDTGEQYLLANVDSAGWVVKAVTTTGSGSNWPYVFLDAGVPKVKTDHASLYTVTVLVEELNSGNTGGLPSVFGLAGLFTSDNGTPKYRAGWFSSDNTLLHSGNYNSYSPTLTGTGASGSWGINITGSSASSTGNAATATTLQTARNINGTSFNGSAAITTATWGTARTITIGSTGKSVDGSAAVSWSLGEIGALPLAGGTMTGDLRFNQGTGFGRIAYADNYHGMILRGIPSDALGNVTVGDYTSLIQHSGDFRFYRTNGSVNELYFQVNATAPYWRGNIIIHAANYSTYSAFTSSLTSTVDVRGPIFYDSNDTAYYLDPANTTLSLKTRSSIIINNASAPQNLAMLNIGYNGAGETRAIDIQGGWSGGENKSITFTHASSSTNIVAQINAQHNGPASRLRWGKLYHGGDSSTYTMELISESTTSAYLTVAGSVRAPIFYDSNDTTYYLDPAAATSLNIAGQITTAKTNGTLFSIAGVDTIGYNSTAGRGAYIKGTGSTYVYGSAMFADGANYRQMLYEDTWLNSKYFDSNGIIYSQTSMRAPIFYDYNDTSYYVDPASTSIMLYVRAANFYDGTGTYNVNLGSGNSEGRGLVAGYSGGSYGGIGYNVRHTTTGGSWIAPSTDTSTYLLFSNGVYFYYAAGGAAGRTLSYSTIGSLTSAGIFTVSGDVRAPIFYDSNNTSYYVDPASTSNLNVLNAVSSTTLWVRSGSWAGDLTSNGFTREIGMQMTGGSEFVILSKSGQGYTLVDGSYYAYEAGGFYSSFNSSYGAIVGFSADSTTSVTFNCNVKAPIYYDSNNTSYYLDPNSASNLNNVTVAGTLTLTNIAKNSTAPIVINSGQSASLGLRVYYDMNLYNTLTFTDSAWNSQGSIFGSSSVVTINAATATTSFVKYAGYSQEGGSFRAPIFYDSDNTAYYIDAASTSNLVGLTVANTITGSVSGNAGTATVLQTARNINGTSFNGSAAITTASWGTARTLTIGSTGKSVDGSAGVSWSLAEIGALPLSGGQITGNTTFSADNHLTFGPNSTWGSSIRIGGNGYTATGTETASVCTTDGNLHLDGAKSTNGIYLNWYGGTSGVFFGNGSSGQVAFVSNAGNASFSGVVDATQFRDASNTGYYLDPAAGTSLRIAGAIVGDHAAWTGEQNKIQWHSSHLYFQNTSDGYFIFRKSNGAEPFQLRISEEAGYATGSWRAPIFYDSNDTTYYTDPASTSWLRLLSVGDVNAANDGGWNARLNLTGSQHARLDVKSNSDGIITTIYSHTGNAAGKVGTMSNHPLVFMVNGNAAGYAYANYIQGADSVRSPIFYDTDNTGYYIDPAGSSNLSVVTAGDFYTGGWFRSNVSGYGIYNQVTGQHFYSDSANYWNIASSAGAQGIRLRTGGYNGTVRGYFYADTANDVGLLNQDGNWRVRVVGGDYTLFSGSSIRAPLFYDSNDTAYYCDPAGTSYLDYSIFNGLSSADYTRQFAPGGGYFYEGGAVTGAIKIRLPANSKTLFPMLSFTCHIYNYSTGTSRTFKIGGHFSSSSWFNPFAYCLSQSGGNLNVRWGFEGNFLCVWIGETNTGWSYPNVFITDFQNGYSSINNSWMKGWVVSRVTAFDTVTNGPTAAGFFWNQNNDGSGSGLDADLVDGLEVHTGRNDNANKIVRTDSNGYIQAGWINTTSGDNGTTAIDRVYASSDGYIRYYTPANFRTVLDVPTRAGSGASGSWGISITGNAATVTNGMYLSGTQTITGINYFRSDKGSTSTVGANSNYALQAFSNDAGAAGMSFHRGGYYAVNMGLDPDNVFRIGGWSASANRWELDMSGNNWVASSFRAPIFYDSNDTNYYVDAASTSRLNLLRTRNTFGERATVTSSSSTTVDTQYNVTELTMSASITTLTLSNIQASTIVHMWTIVTVGNGTTYSITWPAAIKWPGGTAPTITATNAKRDIYQFVTYDGGTTIYAIIVGQNL